MHTESIMQVQFILGHPLYHLQTCMLQGLLLISAALYYKNIILFRPDLIHCVKELYANAFQSCISYNFGTSVMKFHVHYVNTIVGQQQKFQADLCRSKQNR